MGWTYHGGGVLSRVRPKDGKQIVYIRYWFEGLEIKERMGFGKKGLEKARKMRELRRLQIEEGTYKPPAIRRKEKGPTLREFVLEQFLKKHQSRAGTTYYFDVLVGHGKKDGEEKAILNCLGDLHVTEITRADLDRFRAIRSTEVGPSTVRKNLMVIGTIFRKALEWGVIQHSPATMLEKPPEPKHKTRFLTRDEWDALHAAAGEYEGGWLRPILVFAVFTGMRLKEIVGLQWGDVNWKTNMLDLSNDNKSGKPRSVPMNRTVRGLLEDDLGGRFKPREGHVFLCPELQALTSDRSRNRVAQRVKKAMKIAGLGDCSLHTLRHTCASWMVQAGVPLAEVRDVLGHANMQTTLRYAHLQPEHLRAAVNALEAQPHR